MKLNWNLQGEGDAKQKTFHGGVSIFCCNCTLFINLWATFYLPVTEWDWACLQLKLAENSGMSLLACFPIPFAADSAISLPLKGHLLLLFSVCLPFLPEGIALLVALGVLQFDQCSFPTVAPLLSLLISLRWFDRSIISSALPHNDLQCLFFLDPLLVHSEPRSTGHFHLSLSSLMQSLQQHLQLPLVPGLCHPHV